MVGVAFHHTVWHVLLLSCYLYSYEVVAHGSRCSWLNPDSCAAAETPVLGLVFLHNRKSGGTHVLHFLSQWLRANGCLAGFDKQHDIEGVENINTGVVYHRTPPRGVIKNRDGERKCPYIDMYHNEFYCLSGDMVLKYPSIHQLNQTMFKMLTVLRDPIERIGSQFFHTPTCYGRRHIIQTVARMCNTATKHLGACRNEDLRGLPRSNLCVCVIEATKSAFENLRHNESVWFDWLIKSEHGFREQHINNYYIKRLGHVPLEAGRPRYKNLVNANNCLRHSDGCEEKDSSYILLQHAASFHPCPVERQQANSNSDSDALNIAKHLLRDHFHYLLVEYYQDLPSVKKALCGVFGTNVNELVDRGDWAQDPKASRFGHLSILTHELSEQIKIREHNGHIANQNRPLGSIDTIEVGMYQRMMPASVVQYIYEHNKEDYELYWYARELYRERYM